MAVAAVALAIAVPALAVPAPRVIQIKAREFAFDPREITARAIEVTLQVKNEGSIEHNFVIEDAARKTVAQIPVIQAGETGELRLTLRLGAYAIVCNLPGHRDAGMTGSLRVQP